MFFYHANERQHDIQRIHDLTGLVDRFQYAEEKKLIIHKDHFHAYSPICCKRIFEFGKLLPL